MCRLLCFRRSLRFARRISEPANMTAHGLRCAMLCLYPLRGALPPVWLCSSMPSPSSVCSPKTFPLSRCREASICGAMSGTAFLPESIFVSAAISAHMDYREFRFCTISFPFSVCAFRFPTLRQNTLRIRFFQWDWLPLPALRCQL